RSRVEAIKRAPLKQLLPRLRARAQRETYHAPESALRRLAADPGFVLSGVSASEAYDLRLVVKGVLEGYIDARRVKQLSYADALDERSREVGEHALASHR